PDVYFQGRETVNKFYTSIPAIVQKQMDKFAKRLGRQYNLVDYVGAPDAERVIVAMGSGCETVHELVEALVAKGEKVGLVKIRLFLPFPVEAFVKALPKTVRKIAVLDRTKEPGSLGEPLYHNVRTAIGEAMADGLTSFSGYPAIVGGRYGLGSFEFTPAMAKSVFDNLSQDKPKNHFIVGIKDDVTGASLNFDAAFKLPAPGIYSAMFYGLGSDGTVGANKNSIKIIGESTDNNVQAYFVYDSKKAGSMTTSHLRFGREKIRSPYLIDSADFVACHMFAFLEQYDMLKNAKEGATFLLNSPFGKDEVWARLPVEVQKQIIGKKLKFYVIDGVRLGNEIGLGSRINVIMQSAFFKISGIIPVDKAVEKIRDAILKSYGKAGEKVVDMNNRAVDAGLENVCEVVVPATAESLLSMKPGLGAEVPAFVRNTLGPIIDGLGDDVPVSAMPCDGTFPTGTAKYEKRNIAIEIPVWETDLCIQCGICSFVCPHASIRMKVIEPAALSGAPATFKSCDARGKELAGKKLALQVAPEDCTGCGACVHNCPAKSRTIEGRKAINMAPQPPLRLQEAANWAFFLGLPDTDDALINRASLKGSQLLPPTFEFSGACAGCGETPFVKLCSQLFGERMLVDLRRQPPHHPLDDPQGRPGTCLVQLPLRGQRRVRLRLPPDHRQVQPVRPRTPRPRGRRFLPGGCHRRRRPEHPGGDRVTARPRRRPQEGAGRPRGRRLETAPLPGRLPGEEVRLDSRRRRLGLRHRLRRSRPRPGLRRERQRPRPRHRGLLQHRRPGLQGDPSRRRGPVRRRRQAHAE
ncbi:MAG TPA: 2-oxoacid:acceptor oxidoreductase family protein, partial [Deferrimonas sp.]